MAAQLLDDVGLDRGSLNQLHFEAQRMLVEGFAIVGCQATLKTEPLATLKSEPPPAR